ncbi:F-box/LRR-repeat protein 13-like [Silene latifolia]|uniref:F-box/LRR-repeat protein 13-like n=1 Tax=Silene latifolia TaxID=37657 RepID=UPI003D76C23A
MHKLASPFIHDFTLEFPCVYNLSNDRHILVDSWFRLIRKRNVRHLNLAFPNSCNPNVYKSFACIFETTSLVSIKLRPGFAFNNGDPINLPHLKKLDIYLRCSQCKWLNKLILACPLLEELSLIGSFITGNETFVVNCSSPNLRRLLIELASDKLSQVFIDAPKLEYLSARAPKSSSIFFGDKPVSLQQADIQLWNERNNETGLSSTLYQGISDVRILTDHSRHFNVVNTLTAFPNLTRLKLIMKWYDNCKSLSKFLSLCPQLDVLILNFGGFKNMVTNYERWINPTETPLGRVKRIEIVTRNVRDYEHYKYFSELVRYVLRSTASLEQLHISINSGRKQGKGIANNDGKSREYMLCNLIYKCRMASKKCEVVFTGKYLVMSRKAGARHATICDDSHRL